MVQDAAYVTWWVFPCTEYGENHVCIRVFQAPTADPLHPLRCTYNCVLCALRVSAWSVAPAGACTAWVCASFSAFASGLVPDALVIPTCAGPGRRQRCVTRKRTPYPVRTTVCCVRYECRRGVWRLLACATAEEAQKTWVCPEKCGLCGSGMWAGRPCCCTREQLSTGPPRTVTVLY